MSQDGANVTEIRVRPPLTALAPLTPSHCGGFRAPNRLETAMHMMHHVFRSSE